MTDFQALLRAAHRKWHDREFIFEKKDGEYSPITYGAFLEQAASLAAKLLELGLAGKRIVLFGKNSTRLMLADLAVLAFVGTSVNVSFATSAQELAEMLELIRVSAVLYDPMMQSVIDEAAKQCPKVQFFSFQEILPAASAASLSDFPKRDPDTCCKIVFSSGTTANPKAVMLSMRNILAGWEPLYRRAPFCETDVIYLFLPLHHTYANICNFLYCFFSGAQLYLCSSIETMTQELLQVEPTMFCAVPLIFRRLYEQYGERISEAFGRRIRYLFCGGSRFDPQLRRFYKEHGLPMAEAYAMTETASSFSVEYPNRDDFESMGTVYENLNVRILHPDAQGVGDIVAKGEAVFLGYAENPALTAKAFTEDGYFITGDCGYIRNGKLYLTGRKKRVLIGEDGENIFPEDIENKLRSLCPQLVSVRVFSKNGRLECTLTFAENSAPDPDALLAAYNAYAAKKNRIQAYTLVPLRADATLCKS
ncbi:MAG: AMP-binding protein [Acutalibacteraceae bacterium]